MAPNENKTFHQVRKNDPADILHIVGFIGLHDNDSNPHTDNQYPFKGNRCSCNCLGRFGHASRTVECGLRRRSFQLSKHQSGSHRSIQLYSVINPRFCWNQHGAATAMVENLCHDCREKPRSAPINHRKNRKYFRSGCGVHGGFEWGIL